jgi:hypothetical protein|tara:strand:+ start:286 stop:498 length:213 start_codon:yes stop_codon:yes gene_type:complete
MPRFNLINGTRVQFTAAEETARDNEEAQAAIDSQAVIDAATDAANKKASGKQKLLDLGLSEEEVKALIGV